MPHHWIEEQSSSVRHWLHGSACPMIASKADGSIIWANEAVERLLGYSCAELVTSPGSPGLSWQDLTVDLRDLSADNQMVQELVQGHRMDYSMQKSYRSKSGEPVPAMIHVLRWPINGTAECFLVTLMPLGSGLDFMLEEFGKLRVAISEMNRVPIKEPSPAYTAFFRVGVWANQNKLAAAALLLWLSALLVGDRVLLIAERIKDILVSP